MKVTRDEWLVVAVLVALMLLAVLLGTILGETAESRRQRAVGYISEARDVHLSWIELLLVCERDCDQMVARVGTLEHHKEWVRRYDLVLEVLENE